jgi:hypothetical protein
MIVPAAEERPTLSVREAAPLLGVSPATLFRAIANDRSPVAFLRCGARVVVVTASLRRALGLPETTVTTNDAPAKRAAVLDLTGGASADAQSTRGAAHRCSAPKP